MENSTITKIAEWAHGLRAEDIPADVAELCRHQTASVLAACFAADYLPASRMMRGAYAEACAGPVKAAPFGDAANAATACGITAGLSVALDYDDYCFLGHTGHSAVAVPLVLGAHLDLSAEDALAAQVIANEVAGRLGASVVLGPHNGQLWTFIHGAAAALAASRLLGATPEQTAHALALSLAAPPFPSFASLMGPDAKMTLIAEPVAAGVRYAMLARKGFTGPLTALDDATGFYSAFSFTPAKFFLEGLGKSWVTHSLAFKPYPGCAYVDPVVDSVHDILTGFRTEKGRELQADEVAAVRVEATLLTVQMEALGKSFEQPGEMPPTFNLNFRVPHGAAMAIAAGRLSGAEFAPDFLKQNREAILKVASKVRLMHDWDMTLDVVRAFTEGVAPMSILNRIPISGIRRARREAKVHISHELPFDLSSIVELFRHLTRKDLARLFAAFKDKTGSMDEVDFRRLRLPFAARVRLATTDGKEYEAARKYPDGAPGGKNHPGAAADKFLREARRFLGEDGVKAALSAILGGQKPRNVMGQLLILDF